MRWEVVDSKVASAHENMQMDAALLAGLETRQVPVLHFYEWESPSITYGLLVKPEEFLNIESLENEGITLAKRPTGGGVTFHLWDFAFSILVPANHPSFSQDTRENYRTINRKIAAAIESVFNKKCTLIEQDFEAKDKASKRFCMARATQYDLVFEEKKVVGSAQRVKKQGFLHQGMISLVEPSAAVLRRVLKEGTAVLEATLATSYPLLGKNATTPQIKEAKKLLKSAIIAAFQES